MKKYLILIVGLGQSISWASDANELDNTSKSPSSSPQEVQSLEIDLPLLSNFDQFQNLKELTLNGRGKKGSSIPSALTSLTHLQVLKVRGLGKIENSTVYLTALTHLQLFKAEDCFWFTDENIQPFAKLSALQTLHLDIPNEEHFTDVSLQIIKRLARLKDLKLNFLGKKVTSSGLDVIFQLTQLECLSLKWVPWANSPNLINISHLVSLKSLSLKWLFFVRGFPSGIEMIGQLTLLQKLKFTHEGVSKEHLSNLLPSLTNLTSLDLRGCNVFDEGSLAKFLQLDLLPRLTYIYWPSYADFPPGFPFSVPVRDRSGLIMGYKRAPSS